jgi:hypothetical protein
MLKKDTARYIEALKQELEKWRDYEEHRDKPIKICACAICDFIEGEWERLGRKYLACKYCFLYKKNLCEVDSGTSTHPYWLMVVGDEQSPLYEELPAPDYGVWDERRRNTRGLHYPLFRGVMRRAIEAELRRVSGIGRASPFSEEAARP